MDSPQTDSSAGNDSCPARRAHSHQRRIERTLRWMLRPSVAASPWSCGRACRKHPGRDSTNPSHMTVRAAMIALERVRHQVIGVSRAMSMLVQIFCGAIMTHRPVDIHPGLRGLFGGSTSIVRKNGPLVGVAVVPSAIVEATLVPRCPGARHPWSLNHWPARRQQRLVMSPLARADSFPQQ